MPVVHLDIDSDFGGHDLIAWMHWPESRVARDHYLVTQAAQIMHKIQHDALDDAETRLADLLSVFVRSRTNKKSAMITARDIAVAKTKLREGAAMLERRVELGMFEPAGGLKGVAEAGGIAAICKSAKEKGGSAGAACGEILAYIVCMSEHHSELGPSINRAIHLMVERAKHERREIPAERTRKQMWKTWGPIAPVWAAVAFEETRRKALGQRDMSLNDAETRRAVIATAGWLTDFALKMTPKGSKSALLEAGKALTFNSGLTHIKPYVPQLSPNQLAWARAYRAPIPY